MQREFFFVANWKMQLTYMQSIACAKAYTQACSKNTVIVCPSYESLSIVKQELQETMIALGAQDVSTYASGAYTGQVSAQSLKEVGCSYCIVGHSERRQYNQENDVLIVQKLEQLLRVSITPIICVGETAAQKQAGTTLNDIYAQLDPLLPLLSKLKSTNILIAYEPVWAIGTGKQPTKEEVAAVLDALDQYVKKNISHASVFLLYGGSITAETAPVYADIQKLDGFLVGGASIDFQKCKNIVSLEK